MAIGASLIYFKQASTGLVFYRMLWHILVMLLTLLEPAYFNSHARKHFQEILMRRQY
jgi:hypothetical protein